MGIVKFEVEIPDFDKELNINITLKKDGVVVDSMSTTSSPLKESKEPVAVKPAPKKEKKKSSPAPKSNLGFGNMMNLEDDF